MSTTVTYKGATLATVDNATVTLETAGKYCEDDFTLTDVSGGGGSSDFETHTVTITADSDVQLYLPNILDENGWPPNSISCFAYLPANTPKTYTLVFYKGRCYTSLDNGMWYMTGVVDYDYDCDKWYFTGDGSVSMEYD